MSLKISRKWRIWTSFFTFVNGYLYLLHSSKYVLNTSSMCLPLLVIIWQTKEDRTPVLACKGHTLVWGGKTYRSDDLCWRSWEKGGKRLGQAFFVTAVSKQDVTWGPGLDTQGRKGESVLATAVLLSETWEPEMSTARKGNLLSLWWFVQGLVVWGCITDMELGSWKFGDIQWCVWQREGTWSLTEFTSSKTDTIT